MKKISIALFSIVTIFFFGQCSKDKIATTVGKPNLPVVPYNYEDANNFIFNNFGGGPKFCDFCPPETFKIVTNDKATLGRVLFYDTRLSQNNTIACGTCHIQSMAFADGNSKSTGFNGQSTKRNSMALANLGMQDGFFWNNSTSSIEEQSLKPIKNHLEMGLEDFEYLSEKLSKNDYYAPLFAKAFGDPSISKLRISEALGNFLMSMVANKTKFDKTESNLAQLTPLETAGKDLFFSEQYKCSSCHNMALVTSSSGSYDEDPRLPSNGSKGSNIGLDPQNDDLGNGVGGFKIPGLRNIALTAPYMHDGRFKTLDDVLNHYSHGIKNNPTLDRRLQNKNGQPITMNFSEGEKAALKAFLKTLTDESYVSDPKFSTPFN